jgi:hypothetical protein
MGSKFFLTPRFVCGEFNGNSICFMYAFAVNFGLDLEGKAVHGFFIKKVQSETNTVRLTMGFCLNKKDRGQPLAWRVKPLSEAFRTAANPGCYAEDRGTRPVWNDRRGSISRQNHYIFHGFWCFSELGDMKR